MSSRLAANSQSNAQRNHEKDIFDKANQMKTSKVTADPKSKIVGSLSGKDISAAFARLPPMPGTPGADDYYSTKKSTGLDIGLRDFPKHLISKEDGVFPPEET
ncbi:hypothetical protein J7U46_22995 [Pelomonas sp. V22]|uniref:hypothetical protein n=1 Tax=Pelomonas sp. V22 TaxID=2822139 RepID=UPI0024A7E048|nr:hypothetical protein [Pelomonas sp. V22]MDI4635939.1 hypothetical protein [Pelomonas sp. V22]